jgi:methanethiol S-methyltransferase
MDNDIIRSFVPLILGFIAYFALHSLLASLWLKQKAQQHWPQIMPVYRLAFNVLSIILLIPLLLLMHNNPGPLLWQWPEFLGIAPQALMLLASLGFIWSLSAYDNLYFLGISQWRNRHHPQQAVPEQLSISTLHRFVRHPWYFFFLVIMWSQDLHLSQFVTYLLISGYFVIGSRLEEKKLTVEFGEVYQQYCQKVPGLFPLPWRWLSKKEALRLSQLAATTLLEKSE